jgi:hypothetical protein
LALSETHELHENQDTENRIARFIACPAVGGGKPLFGISVVFVRELLSQKQNGRRATHDFTLNARFFVLTQSIYSTA